MKPDQRTNPVRNTEFAKVRWGPGPWALRKCSSFDDPSVQQARSSRILLAIEPTKVRTEGLTKDPGAHRSCQDQAAKIRVADLPDSAVNLLTCILNWPEGSLRQPLSVCLSSTIEIADGAHRLLVKNAQSQEAGEAALHMGHVQQSLALGRWRSNWDGTL
jgi:hypothetical protein